MSKWFKRKRYGWGWTPSTWQGWAVTFGFVAFVTVASVLVGGPVRSPLLYFGILVTSMLALIAICYIKGEKPKWSWGNPDDDEMNS